MTEALGQKIEEDNDWPAALKREAELEKPYWVAFGVELLKLASERCARLKTMLARHQANDVEARPRLAAEASFDDTAEGERLHRYQERWGRSLLRTLAALEELRRRGRLDHQEEEAEGAPVGQDFDPVIPFIEETRSESGCMGGGNVNKGPAGSVGADPVEETEWGHDPVAADEPSIRREEKRQNKPTADRSARREEIVQNKPTAVRRTVVTMDPCALRPVEIKATMACSPCRESDQSGSAMRPGGFAAVVNYPCRE
jgi:hypothetical protein